MRYLTLYSYFFYFVLATGFSGTSQLIKDTPLPAINKIPSLREAGYFFALREVPLSREQFIFTADPLKRAVYVDEGQNIPLSHSMTVKNAKGFDMYFSAADYNIILAVTETKAIDSETNIHKGNLVVHHGREKHKYAVHGLQYR